MSFDLTFAKPKRKIAKKRVAELYAALVHGGQTDAFEPLPIDEILGALCEAYEGFEPAGKFPTIQDEQGSAAVSRGPCHFSFGFRGNSSGLQERIIGIFQRFGCPVYDPQAAALYPLDQPFGVVVRADAEGWTPPLKTKGELEAQIAELHALAEKREREKRDDNREWYEIVDKLTAQIERERAGGRWARLGIDAETCAGVLHNMTTGEGDESERPPDDILGPGENLNQVWLAYLDAIPPGHQCADPVPQARMGVARAIEYFHGAWREGHREYPYSKPMTRKRSRTKLDWILPYRDGLLMALYVDDEDAIRRLIAWPGTDLPVDNGLDTQTAGDNQAQIALAYLLRGEPRKKIAPVLDKLQASKRKRAMVFWAAAEAIADKDDRAFVLQMRELGNLYRKSAATRETFPDPHVDGSILWHVARRAGIVLTELPERLLDWIVH